MDIHRYYNFDWVNPGDAPDDKGRARRIYPVAQGDGGPCRFAVERSDRAARQLLHGAAPAAVILHTKFSATAPKGHRQKDVTEGQTFAKKS